MSRQLAFKFLRVSAEKLNRSFVLGAIQVRQLLFLSGNFTRNHVQFEARA